MKITISQPSKLNGIRGFSLPAIDSCIGRTSECTRYCYATKNRFNMKDIKNAYQRNLEITDDTNFVGLMCKALSPNERYFRVHVSGDFYSQRYLNDWITVALEKPNIKFMAYTRSWQLDFSWLPDNLIIRYTVDSTTPMLPNVRLPLAIVGEYYKHNFTHLGEWVMPTADDEPRWTTYLCNSDNCMDCRFCWNSNKDITFPQKYKKYSTSKVYEHLNKLVRRHDWI